MISCVLLVVNNFSSGTYMGGIEAVRIDESYPDLVYDRVDEVSLSYEGTITEIKCEKGLDTLVTVQEREVYNRLGESVYNISKDKDDKGRYTTERIRIIDSYVSEESLRHALNAYLFDNPQIFWLNNVFGYVHSDGDTIIECYTDVSADECKVKIEQFGERIDQLLDGISADMTPYSREKLIHDRLLQGCSYAEEVKGFSDGWHYFSAYGAIVEGRAVCEGYAKAFQLLSSRVGVECCTIRGQGDGISHMWNLVNIDGSWYHVDATWDDTEDLINYEHFNVDDNTIKHNHVIAEQMTDSLDAGTAGSETKNFFVPVCDSMDMNYYYVEGMKMTGFGDVTDDAMIAFIANRARNGDMIIPIVISPDLDYNDCIDKLFYSSPFRFYYYIDQANEHLDPAHKIDKNSIKLLRNEENRTLRVRLNYAA